MKFILVNNMHVFHYDKDYTREDVEEIFTNLIEEGKLFLVTRLEEKGFYLAFTIVQPKFEYEVTIKNDKVIVLE